MWFESGLHRRLARAYRKMVNFYNCPGAYEGVIILPMYRQRGQTVLAIELCTVPALGSSRAIHCLFAGVVEPAVGASAFHAVLAWSGLVRRFAA